jgi:Domain of unknown function (DUF4386)
MNDQMTPKPTNPQTLARIVGLSFLGTLLIGIASSFIVVEGININLSADIIATAQNMLESETDLRAKAYIAAGSFSLAVIFNAGLFLLLRRSGPLLAMWSLVISMAASVLSLMGAVFALNAAHIAGNQAYAEMANESQRLLLTGLQATSDYTSFHLGLVLSSLAMAGFFYLFWRSDMIPRLISGWGVFASLFVASMIVSRDFIPMLGHFYVTASFMASNLIAMVAMSLYLCIKGVRTSPNQHA